MKPLSTLILPVVTLAAGAGIGYFAGRSPQAPSAPARPAVSGPSQETATYRLEPKTLPSSTKETASAPRGEKSKSEPITGLELQSGLRSLSVPTDLLVSNMGSLREIADLRDRLRASDVAAMAEEMANAGPSLRRDTFGVVMTAYAEKDPGSAWAFACGLKTATVRHVAQNAVLVAIADADPVQGLAMIDALADNSAKRSLRTTVFSKLAQKDPQRAWALYQQSPNADGRYNFIATTIFSQWGAEDPEAAKAAASRLTGSAGDQARGALVNSIAQTDPQAAWAYAMTLPSKGEGWRSPLVQAVSAWSQSDPEAALKAAMSIQEVGLRGTAVATAINAWSSNDLDGALKFAIAEQDATTRSDMFRSMRASSNDDRHKLLSAMMEHMPAGDNYQRTVSGLLHEWARTDPREAAYALGTMPPGRIYNDMVSRVASEWSEQVTDRRELLDWIRQMPPGEARGRAYRGAFSEWSSLNPQEALAAAQGLMGEDRDAITQAVASGWGERDPQAVLRWSSGIQDPKQRGEIVRRAVGQWARYSPEEASRYVQTLAPDLQTSTMRTLIDGWASKDVEAAAQWLQGQPATPTRDVGIEAIVQKIAQEDPASAIAWASSISDTGKRNGQVERVARDWIRQDSANAKAWIGKSNLPPEMREKLLK